MSLRVSKFPANCADYASFDKATDFFFLKYKMLELLGVTSQFRAPLNRVYMNM